MEAGTLGFFSPFRIDERFIVFTSPAPGPPAGAARAVFIHSLAFEADIEQSSYQGAGQKQNQYFYDATPCTEISLIACFYCSG